MCTPTFLLLEEQRATQTRASPGSNLNVVSGRDQGNDVSAGANPASGPRSRIARAGPRSGPAQSETQRSERSRWETSASSIKLALRERKRKTPIDIRRSGSSSETPPGRGRHHLRVAFSLARAGGRCPVPLGASMAAHPEEILFVSECAYPRCSKLWAICRRCYRGHKYCSKACSKVARVEKKRQYNCETQQGPGRDRHRDRQRALRLRRRYMSTTLRHSQAAFSEPRLWWGDS